MGAVVTLTPTGSDSSELYVADCDVVDVDEDTRTPTADDSKEEYVDPASEVTVKVFAAEDMLLVVPPGVVTVTTVAPVGALAAMTTVTVAMVPSMLTAGGLLTEIPVPGVKLIKLADARFWPRTLSVNVLPTCCLIGWMASISGVGRVTLNWFAPGAAGWAVTPPSTIVRATSGAFGSMSIMACTELPSTAALKVNGSMVMPVDGIKVMLAAEASPAPFT